MAFTLKVWQMNTTTWLQPMMKHCRLRGHVFTQEHCPSRRYASKPFLRNGKKSLRKYSHSSRMRKEELPTEDVEEARLERLMKQQPESLLAVNRKLVRSGLVYAGLIGFLTFSGAAFLSQAETKSLAQATPGSNSSIKELRAMRNRCDLSAAQQSVYKWQRYLNKELLRYYAKWREAYLNASDSKKGAYMIASLNIGVCLAWQTSMLTLRLRPNVLPFMMRWFLHRPLEQRVLDRSITPLTSMFSHTSLAHLLFNNICLVSFATSAGWYISSQHVQTGGRKAFSHGYDEPQELAGRYHFLAFFLTAGVFASLGATLRAQFLAKKVLRSGHPTVDAYRRANTPGLGASGATYAVVVVSALASPEGRVGIPFLTDLFPVLTLEKRYGIMALIGVDVVGLVSGWTTFGHAVHLGGAAFGAVYYFIGPRMWATIRGREI